MNLLAILQALGSLLYGTRFLPDNKNVRFRKDLKIDKNKNPKFQKV